MYPHRIRLRGPWECVPEGDGAPPARRVNMPCRWADAGLASFRGVARFLRKFGHPGKADPDLEHIWLTCDGCTGARDVVLNGTRLTESPGASFAFDVTRLMAARNQLDVAIHGDADDAGLWGEVALEMRKDAYLEGVRVECVDNQLAIIGNVVGVAPRPLELYTMVDHKHVDYRTINPCASGTPFCVEVKNPSAPAEVVRVELIHISEVWYVVETPISHRGTV